MATIGQCREGFLEHTEAITGRQLSAADLEPLDLMLRIEFCREHVGLRFHPHLAALLREESADLVIINPLLSYIGGEVVAEASTWLRAGLMPILQEHKCAALIAHHTPKLAKDGWQLKKRARPGWLPGERPVVGCEQLIQNRPPTKAPVFSIAQGPFRVNPATASGSRRSGWT